MEATDLVKLAPGMSHTVEPGEKLLITDSKGEELQIETRDAPEVLSFFESFDNWLTIKNKGIVGVVLDAAWDDVLRKFTNLPGRIQNELPSIRSLGVTLRNNAAR